MINNTMIKLSSIMATKDTLAIQICHLSMLTTSIQAMSSSRRDSLRLQVEPEPKHGKTSNQCTDEYYEYEAK